MYGKIFDSMYEGTLYGHWEAIATLQQMLVLCTPDGVVDMTPQAIAARTSFPLEIIAKGLKVLGEPDPYTRTPGEEGRRIILLDDHRPWGWRIVNHAKYQAMRNRADKNEADRLRIAEQRKAQKNNDVAGRSKTSQIVANVAPTDSSASASSTTSPKVKSKGAGSAFATPSWIDAVAWQAFEQMRSKARKPMTDRARELIVKELESLQSKGFDPVAVLEQSVRNNWQDVFPLKDKGSASSGKSLIQLMDERDAKRAAN